MDEDIKIISTNTRNEKIKNFFINNKKLIISILIIIISSLILYFVYAEYKKNEKKKISDLYNSTVINHSKVSKSNTIEELIKIINFQDATYSPLSLYFIIDNQLITDRAKINSLFDILITKTSLEEEIKNLVIYKKGLFNADESNENELLIILNPVINSDSIWKSHALYLLAEYFYSKNEKQKSKDFFDQIINFENSNPDIIQKAQKRLNRDLSD